MPVLSLLLVIIHHAHDVSCFAERVGAYGGYGRRLRFMSQASDSFDLLFFAVSCIPPLPLCACFQVLSGQGAKAAANARLVAAFLPRMCTDGVCPAWRPGGTVDVHDIVMSR